MVKALSNLIVTKLEESFVFVDYGSDENEIELKNATQAKLYDIKSISIFDHCLTEEEYVAQNVVYYGDRLRNDSSLILYKSYEKKFLDFYNYLYDQTQIYSFLFDDKGNKIYIQFTTKESYLSHVLLSIREQLFLKVILPEYHAFIDGGYDLTHILRVKKEHPESFETIGKIAAQHGLYILD